MHARTLDEFIKFKCNLSIKRKETVNFKNQNLAGT